ncbi:MarR family winged helix-turn-helix transcriptional regulator [Conexibacter arvalis]|uniref:DNA-binding MarR family transcriptional regulator n=1 Tax=Conexibacter arvalis TaxID=912552 RepID=A0A840IFB0_9ACTN|nr:MarR family transcriptional regulator [Conexibacter arvalis]MBB4663496.1 DNA-binding MarR family transcriptional regulator [Conexibacter arvalis]
MSAEAAAREQRTDELRAAFGELLAAERRLRSRDPQRPGALSYAQVRALARLDDAEQATAGELAKAADLTPASVTAMLDQLEQAGMVERRRGQSDRRQVVVSLTPAGRALLREKRARWRGCWEAATDDLSERELEAAGVVMRRLARLLDGL